MRDSDLPLLLIITGLPCSGKTTVARRVAAALNLPLLTKDDLKERLFDTLGWSDRAWSRKLSAATYAILYYLIEAMLAGGASLAVEGNFPPQQAGEQLNAIRQRLPFRAGVIECVARAEVLKQRWRQRAETGGRHPGHNDAAALDEFLRLIDAHTDADGYARLGAPLPDAPLWVVDTSQRPDLAPLIEQIRERFGFPCQR